MHRDISFNNIMLDAMGELLLNDWDHAGLTMRKPEDTHKSFRTVSTTFPYACAELTRAQGTWPFMSIALLQDSSKPHDILDDLESVFWSKLWGGVKYFSGRVVLDMSVFFEKSEETVDGDVRQVGGDKKRALLLKPFASKVNFLCAPFQALVSELFKMWSLYYVAASDVGENFHQLRQEYGRPKLWVEVFDKHMGNKEEWLEADIVADRYPLKSEKEIEEKLREQLFSHSIRLDAATKLTQISEHEEDKDEDFLGSRASDNGSSNAFDDADPEPAQSILDNGTSINSGSCRSPPSLSLNSNGKRTTMSFVDDDDGDNAEEYEAALPSPLPKAKRSRKASRAPPVAAVAAPSTSDRVLRSRTRSGPVGRRGEAREGPRSGRRVASTID